MRIHLAQNDTLYLQKLEELYLLWGSLGAGNALFNDLESMPNLRLMNVHVRTGNRSIERRIQHHPKMMMTRKFLDNKLMKLELFALCMSMFHIIY